MGAALSLLPGWGHPGSALAHGKEVTVEVAAFTPDAQQPLIRLYRALVTYADDRDPVAGAEIYLGGRRRQGGETLPLVRLAPLNLPGLYAGQVAYPRYGTWELLLEAKEPGQGVVSLVEEVLPAALSRESQPGDGGSQKSIFTVSLAFDWRDVAHLGMRWVHSLAAVAWFGLSGLIVAGFALLQGEPRARFLGRLNGVFPWAGAVSLALLAGTGVYNAVYNSPLRPPGVFSFEVMGAIPYGTAYLTLVGLKVLTVIVGVGLALGLARGLRLAAALPVASNAASASELGQSAASGKRPPLLPLAVGNLTLGLVALLNVAATAYLHNLSHLAVLVPRQ